MNGDYAAAIRELAAAEQFVRAEGDEGLLVGILIQKSAWLRDTGAADADEALAEAERTLNTRTDLGDTLLPILRLEQSRAALSTGLIDRATVLLDSALTALGPHSSSALLSDVRQNQASISLFQGRLDEALAFIGEAEALDRRFGNTLGVANDLTVKGSVFRAMGDDTNAREAFLAAIQEAKTHSHLKEAADAATNLAQLMDTQGESEAARDLLAVTIDQYRDLGDQRAVTNALSSLGIISLKLGDSRAAQQQLHEAVDARTRNGDFPYVLYDRLNLAAATLEDNMDAAADGAAQLANEADRTGLVNLSWRAHALLAYCHLRRALKREVAAEVVEPIKSSALPEYRRALDFIDKLRASIKDADNRRFVLADKQRVYEEAVLAALLAGDPKLAFSFSERSRARAYLDALARQFGETIAPSMPMPIEAIAARLPEGTALLSYFVGEGYCAIFPIKRQGLEGAALLSKTNRQHLSHLTELAGLEVTNEQSSFPRNEELADLLIGPTRPVIANADHLIIVPHGPLHNLAFAALRPQLEKDARKFLTESHRLSHLPAASFVELCLTMERPPFSIGSALVIGDPERDLPESRREAVDIAQVLGVEPVIGPNAKRATLLGAPSWLGTIHVSCHGFFDAKTPMRSGLNLADGPVSAHDLSKANLRAGRLVLSACLTGMASVIPGDELLGLTRACFDAGVPTVITALTAIWEDSSRAFFGVFYRQIAAGRSTAAAFSDAVAAVRAVPAFSQPVHWAPYILNGDWR